ncbi:hypothetical protein DMC61_19820 [Amycolatopsis sp. WAC 04169]|uniref:hypothetical protein n=1 Tax=Amycolatopsis sp. WAC 04169 TaxID=2203197 RepID=UPI000F798DE6|nr:hypothetical protein [Amycolatopsis sp. WAC 04169]RSN28787.1 hypothetical protein DMC61_19820 [Amycolatopsis sp. WAC 04169]
MSEPRDQQPQAATRFGADDAVEDEFGEELFEPDVPDQVVDEVEQLAFDRAYTVGEEAIDLFENVLREAEGEADALAETLRMFDGDSLTVAQAALDLYTAHRGTEDEPPDHAELAATVAAEQAVAQDPDVVLIDPDELMPADEALRNYDVADEAVGRFAQLRTEGWDHDAAAARAVEASLDETGLAVAAVIAYRRQLDAGQSHDAARFAAVSETATAFTSRISAEQADQVRAALTHPADDVEHASAHDTGEESTMDSNEPGTSAQADAIDETVGESTTFAAFAPGDVVRSRITGELSTVTDDAATWDPAFYAPADEVELPEVAELAPDAGGWIARNLPARDNTPSTGVPEMDLRTAIELVAEDSRIESGNEGLTARDAAVAARELTEEDIHDVVESDATRAAYLTVINAFDADVDQALAALSTAPSNDGQASAWPVVDQDETAAAAGVAADETVARIDQVLADDADGDVSEEDAEDQYIEQRRASLRAELAAAADGMTVEDARAIVREADGLEDHLSSCSQDVSQCSTCSQQEHETSDFWTVDVPAARQRLASAADTDQNDVSASVEPVTRDSITDRFAELRAAGADPSSAARDAAAESGVADAVAERFERMLATGVPADLAFGAAVSAEVQNPVLAQAAATRGRVIDEQIAAEAAAANTALRKADAVADAVKGYAGWVDSGADPDKALRSTGFNGNQDMLATAARLFTHYRAQGESDADACARAATEAVERHTATRPTAREVDDADEDDDVDSDEDTEPPLAERVAECERAVEDVEDAVRHHDRADEDTERAERCARWNTEDDAADEDAAGAGDEWGQG